MPPVDVYSPMWLDISMLWRDTSAKSVVARNLRLDDRSCLTLKRGSRLEATHQIAVQHMREYMMGKIKSIGMIGLDTSHAAAFAAILHDAEHPYHVPGGRIKTAWRGGSPDMEMSISRVEDYTQMLRDDFGVEILDTPEAVAEQSDLVFIETIDGRVHADLFKRIAPFGKPVFIDKPLAVGLSDAQEILTLANESGIPVMSCSALRYADNLQAALAVHEEDSAIAGCDAYGPMSMMLPLPGLYWYGIHTVEVLVTALGTGCRKVHVTREANTDLIVCKWGDGRIGTIRGQRDIHSGFGVTLHRKSGPEVLDLAANDRPWYASMLEAILRSLPEGRSDIADEEMLEVIRIIDAANESRESGKPVEIRT